jgi:cytidine deaminase
MNIKSIHIEYSEYANKFELSEGDQLLINQAYKALEKAYAPYSKFSVGAALLLDDGSIITANNQENIAYPSAMCAERVALYYCKAQQPHAKIVKMAIMAKSSLGELVEVISPCGACRQVMSEYERIQSSHIEVLLKGENEHIIVFKSVKDLLPLSFETKVL